jgi:hypothetical protein
MKLGVFALRKSVTLDYARGNPDRPRIVGSMMPDGVPDAEVFNRLLDVKN